MDHFSLGRLTANELIGIRTVRLGASQLFANAVLVNSANEVITTSDTVRQGSPLGGTSFEFVIPTTDTYYLRILPDTTEEGGATVSTGAYSLFYSAFGVVVPLGTNGDDVLRLRASANGSMLEIFNADPATNPPIRTWPMNQAVALQIDTLDGNDQVIVQLPSGTNGPIGGVQFNAGGGNNTLLIQSGNIAIDSVATAGGTLNTTVADAAQLTTPAQPEWPYSWRQ